MASAAPAFPSTRETTNYSRLCRLLVDVGSQVLRETFDRIHPPGGVDRVLGTPPVLNTLQLLRRKRILNPAQWGKLFPAIKSKVSSKDFDITLLMVLLRNICGLTPPATGWDNLPPVTDLTPEADIARVKYYRNEVYGHASHASIDDATISTYWKDIRDTLVRLGGATYETAIDDLKDECMDPDVQQHYQELLRQWKVDEDNIKNKLDEMVEKLDDVKASVDDLEKRTAPVTGPVHGGSLLDFVGSLLQPYLDNSGQLNYKGQVIHYSTHGRIHSWREMRVYDATAWDKKNGISAEARGYDSSQEAIQHAVEKLKGKLRDEGIIKE